MYLAGHKRKGNCKCLDSKLKHSKGHQSIQHSEWPAIYSAQHSVIQLIVTLSKVHSPSEYYPQHLTKRKTNKGVIKWSSDMWNRRNKIVREGMTLIVTMSNNMRRTVIVSKVSNIRSREVCNIFNRNKSDWYIEAHKQRHASRHTCKKRVQSFVTHKSLLLTYSSNKCHAQQIHP